MSITTIGRNLVHYEALGRGKPLIFIHGWLGSWRYWWPSMQALATHYRTFALDLWGFGDSSKVSEKYSLSNYMEMLDQFIEGLGIAVPVVIVGHGLGAGVAIRYALQNPEDVARIALVGLPVSGAALNTRLVQGDNLAAAIRVTGRARTFPEIEVELRKSDPVAVTALMDEMHRSDFSNDLQQLSCPLLLLFGGQDPLIQQPNGEHAAIRETAFNRAYICFDSCMHFPMLEETAKFNRLVLEFLHSDNDLRSLSPKNYWKRRTH